MKPPMTIKEILETKWDSYEQMMEYIERLNELLIEYTE